MHDAEPEKVEQDVPAAPVVVEDAAVDREEEKVREAAYRSVPEWKGEALEPLSVSREAAWLELRCAMGAPRLALSIVDGSYADGGGEVMTGKGAWIADALRLLCICSMSGEEVTRARQDAVGFQMMVDAWGDANVKQVETVEAELVAYEVYNAARENRVEAQPDDGTGRKSSGK